MGDVAARAGVAKTTLYRRWPGKNELVVDAVAVLFDELELPDLGSLAADVESVVRQFAALLERPEAKTALMAVVAEATCDERRCANGSASPSSTGRSGWSCRAGPAPRPAANCPRPRRTAPARRIRPTT